MIVFDVLATKIPFFAAHTTFFYDMDTLPILIISFMLFLGFASINIGHVPFINTISSACFGIYLIHDNNYIRELLWSTIFRNANYEQSDFLILYTLAQIALVFVACAILELIRIHLVEKQYLPPLEKLSDWFNKKTENIFSHNFFERF